MAGVEVEAIMMIGIMVIGEEGGIMMIMMIGLMTAMATEATTATEEEEDTVLMTDTPNITTDHTMAMVVVMIAMVDMVAMTIITEGAGTTETADMVIIAEVGTFELAEVK